MILRLQTDCHFALNDHVPLWLLYLELCLFFVSLYRGCAAEVPALKCLLGFPISKRRGESP
jgi:hypothetical protein